MATLRAFLDIFLAPVENRFGLLGPKIITLLDRRGRDAKRASRGLIAQSGIAMRSRLHLITTIALAAVAISCTSARRGSKSKDDASSSDGADGVDAPDVADVGRVDTTDGAADVADGADAAYAVDAADATNGVDGQDGTGGTLPPTLTTITELQTSTSSTGCTSESALVVSPSIRIEGAVVVGPKFLLYAGDPGDPENTPLDGYYLTQGGVGANRGLLLAVPSTLGVSLAVGQSVTVEGEHVEYYCLSEIRASKVTPTGNGVVPNPLVVDPVTLTQTPEPYEGSLLRLDDLTVTSVTSTEVQLSGGIRVQWKHYPFVWQPTIGQVVESVVGFLDYQYGEYLLQPRGLTDIVLGEVVDPALETIFDIQNEPSSLTCEKSNGSLVTQPSIKVKGTVISPLHEASKTLDGVWMYEETPDQKTGLCVVFPKTLGFAPKVGDVATFEGSVKEFYCLTELEATAMTVTGTGSLPAPDYATAADITLAGGEYWEGHYVTLSGLSVVSNANYAQYGEIEVDSGLLIDGSDFGVALPFVPGDSLSATGVVTYAFSDWRVLPFSPSDVVLE